MYSGIMYQNLTLYYHALAYLLTFFEDNRR
jgi:hypothetical protein